MVDPELLDRLAEALEHAAGEIDTLDALGCPACGAQGAAKDNEVWSEVQGLLEELRRARLVAGA